MGTSLGSSTVAGRKPLPFCYTLGLPRGAARRQIMVYYLLVTLYVLVCLLLMVVILLQQGKGGDMASAFGGGGGSQTAFGARSGATLLTKATTGLGAAFIIISTILAIWGQQGPRSVVGGIGAPAPAATAPAAPATTTPPATTPAPAAATPAPDANGTPAAPAKPPQ